MCFLDCALCLVLDPMFGSWKFEGNAREAVERERERRKTLFSFIVFLLTIERYIYTRLGVLTTIHVTYINKER